MPKDKKVTHYITVNGEPACVSSLTVYLDPPSVCQHESLFEAIRMKKRIAKQLPDEVVEIVEGHCPQPGAREPDEDYEESQFEDWA